jgi:hypothetical protein
MTDMRLQSTTVSAAEGGALRVEISISDTPDIATARQSVVVRYTLEPNEFPLLLEEIQFATLTRIQTILGQHISELREKIDRARHQ